MIKRIINTPLPCMVYNPVKTADASYAVAAYEAGAMPVIDTEFIQTGDVLTLVDQLAARNIIFGVRLFASDTELIGSLSERRIDNLDLVVLAYRRADELSGFDSSMPYRIFIETTDININDKIDSISPQALIVKGFEGAGKVSKYTSYVLLQWYLDKTSYPVVVHGGVGQYTASGMFAAGASGVVLDSQLYLADESPLSDNFRDLLRKVEENSSSVIGKATGIPYRFFAKLGTKIVKELKEKESVLAAEADGSAKLYRLIEEHLTSMNDSSANTLQSLFYLGQDGVFSKNFVKNGTKLKDMLHGFFKTVGENLADIEDYDPIRENTTLAREHGTRFPIVQGPMGNISDSPDFAKNVYDSGALPFFALGNLPVNLAENMVKGGAEKKISFGAGMIGIGAMNKSFQEHIDMVKRHKAPFALFAAGIPAQVLELEAAGTKTYLHTPSMQMLENAMKSGCSRFIFEGNEAGGHVGGQTSMVLWELGMNRLMELDAEKVKNVRAVFGGGIGTSRGSWFVSGMTSCLARKGGMVGIQVGTLYLMTEEIVKTGALSKVYHELILKSCETIVMGETVGLMSRSLPSVFSQKMIENEHQRIRDGLPLGDRKVAFEHDNVGALLVGAKGYRPKFNPDGKVELVKHTEKDQFDMGNFMAGDSIACEDRQINVPEVSDILINRKKGMFANLDRLEVMTSRDSIIHDEIAVIGMGCVLPDAGSPEELWKNILDKKYSITRIDEKRLSSEYYFSEDRKAEGKAYSRIAGQVSNFKFDYRRFGFTSEEAGGLSRSQQMILESAARAADDAGLSKDSIPGNRSAVVIGTCLSSELMNDLLLKYNYPEIKYYIEQIEEFKSLDAKTKKSLLEELKKAVSQGHTAESPEGAMNHMEASRIAEYLGIKGPNYTVDAACATSLAAIDSGIKELRSGKSDLVLAGGINTNLSPESFIGFCKMGALSGEGSYPFDERSGGFVLGEGAGVFVLKRMKDALRDGDRIHAVIKATGASSDGKGKAIAAPNPAGQEYALNRCFENMLDNTRISDVDFIECHGTSTLMGDLVETQTVKKVYNTGKDVYVSSVKSQIGHLLGGAGSAGMLKLVMALKNKILPPNGQFKKHSPRLEIEGTHIKVVTDALEWKKAEGPRIGAISSFGFGGINYHCVVQEFTEGYTKIRRRIFSEPSFNYNMNRVVITGVGVKLPGAESVEEMWAVLDSGKSVLGAIPEARYHAEAFTTEEDSLFRLAPVKAGVITGDVDSKSYRVPPAAARVIDRGQFYALEAAGRAMKQCGLDKKLDKGNKIAAVFGALTGEMLMENVIRIRIPLLQEAIHSVKGLSDSLKNSISEKIAESLKERYAAINEDTVPGMLSNIISGRVANFYGLNGANFIVDAGSMSSAVACNLAMKGLQSGEYDFALAGGVESNISAPTMRAFQRMGIIGENGGSIFDGKSTGTSLSEGAVVFALTTLEKALENNMPVLGEINGIAIDSSAGARSGELSTEALVRSMNDSLNNSPLKKEDISYIDIYGASRAESDKNEIAAVERVFGAKAAVGSSKPVFGYLRSASPAFAIAKLIGARKFGKTPGFNAIKPGAALLKASSAKIEGAMSIGKHDYAAANIFGIGGNHGFVVTGAVPDWAMKKTRQFPAGAVVPRPVPLAAQPSVRGGGDKITALLSGQGAQRSGMMKELYESVSIIRDTLDRGNEIFRKERGQNLLDIMFGDDPSINSTEITQPAVFLSSAALYDYAASSGFSPDYFIGHSLGEITALYCSGILAFEDAMRLVIKRSELMKADAERTAGRIMVLFKGWEESQGLIDESGIKNVFVANKNSEVQTAVSGAAGDIDSFMSYLKQKNVTFKALNLSGAFHTPFYAQASDSIRLFLKDVKFKSADYTKVISNVTGLPYPQNEDGVKDLVARQIVSPVNFIQSVGYAFNNGSGHFVEFGPGRLLVNLLKNITLNYRTVESAVDVKAGELASLRSLDSHLKSLTGGAASSAASIASDSSDPEFKRFLEEKKDEINTLLANEFNKYKMEDAGNAVKRFGFYTGKIVVSGAAIGLPGSANRVFAENNFDRIIAGENFIDSLTAQDKAEMLNKNIVRVYKDPAGNAKFIQISKEEEVIQLAGKLGYFSLANDYGIDFEHDYPEALAMAAGIEALKDAGIPLVQGFKKASNGAMIPGAYELPQEMQDRTGVICTSVFAGLETFSKELRAYYEHRFLTEPYEEFKKMYYFMMEKISDTGVKDRLTEWFSSLRKAGSEKAYNFDRTILFKIINLAPAHFAQHIKAKGPNTHTSAACASTTQAICIAEDWIRTGRCDRVILIGGEAANGEGQGQWIQSGFLALGAATVKKTVQEAAKPFDEDRNGTIVGSGAVALIIEKEECAVRRGQKGQAEILGTYFGNSAFHATRIDVEHVAREMKNAVIQIEKRHGLNRDDYARHMVFMSHETYTPARGGSASAEVMALREAYPQHYREITITNTKGFTGHTLGAGIEDAILIKALLKGKVPPIANLVKIPQEFADLKFSKGEPGDYRYGMHFGAGFGSHFAFALIKKGQENCFENNPEYTRWLKEISGSDNPELVVMNGALCIKSAGKPLMPRRAPEVKAPASQAVQTAVTAPSAPAGGAVHAVKEIISEYTGYSEDMLDENLDLEGDLGIDTVKQVEIFGAVSQKFGFDVPEDLKLGELNTIAKLAAYIAKSVPGLAAPSASALVQAAAPAAAPASGGAVQAVKEIISEYTGYSEDMLDENLDLEGDLGIDTVKQVEIFGVVSQKFGFDVPEDLKLGELNTIAKLAAYIAQAVPGLAVAPSPSAPVQAAAPAAAPASGGAVQAVKEIISEYTGYEVEMLDETLDLEGDLGIDTVKQVEIFGAVSQKFGFDVPEDLKLGELNTIAKLAAYIAQAVPGLAVAPSVSAPVQAAAPASGGAVQAVKEIISEYTGYEVEMLDETLDLEGDLGIDTVKQVEIFGAVSQKFGFDVPEDLKLGELNTIAKLAAYIAQAVPGLAVAPSASAQVQAAAPAVAPASGGAAQAVKEIISEYTGYEVEMLDETLDLEGDLGIDTVKQVEIFGAVSQKFGFDVPEDLKLGELNTIAKLAAYIAQAVPGLASAPSASAPVQAAAPAAAAPASGGAAQAVKEIISEYTGYEVEMLDETLDLEGDLGIDTVKQVEIFGAVSQKFGFDVPEDLKLGELNTIAKLAAYIAKEVPGAGAAVQPSAAEQPAVAVATEAGGSGIKRFEVGIAEAAPVSQKVKDLKGKTYLVTLDKSGFSDRVTKRLKAMGAKVVTLGVKGADYNSMGSFEKLESDIRAIASDESLYGVIHCAPVAWAGKPADEESINVSVKSLFLIIKGLYGLLNRKGGIIAAPAFDSVVFPYSGEEASISPVSGGVAGMLKTASKEMKDTACKVVDFSFRKAGESFDIAADIFMNEIFSGDRTVETGYRDGVRYKISLKEAAAVKGDFVLKEGDTVIVTGGAGGITFEMLKDIASRINVKFVILGRSRIDGIEPDFMRLEADERYILGKLKDRMQGAKPLELKKEAGRIIRARSAADNIETLRKTGCEVEYHAADVADAVSVEKALKGIKNAAGIIHAAGIEESQFIEKKEFSQFNRVFDVKVYGALNILKAVPKYRFLATFSSVAARFGNEGQIDYSSANDLLSKIVLRENQLNSGKICKIIDWTAWDGAGMATNETVMKVLKERGMKFLPLKEGVRFFMDELSDPRSIETAVMGLDLEFDPDRILPGSGSPSCGRYPFLGTPISSDEKKAVYSRVLDINTDLFLLNHSREGVPLFLGATGVESLAEASSRVMPEGRRLISLKDFTIPYGIKILQGRPKEIMIEAEALGDEAACRIVSQFKNKAGIAMGDMTVHYNGTCVFSGAEAKAKKISLPEFKPVTVEGDFQELIYHPERLFMDGVFRSIQGILSFDGKKLVTKVRNPLSGEFFRGCVEPEFVTDPVLVDAMFQTGGVVEFLTSGVIILPSSIRVMNFYAGTEAMKDYLCITEKKHDGEETNTFDLWLTDEAGNVFVEVLDFQMIKIKGTSGDTNLKNRIRTSF